MNPLKYIMGTEEAARMWGFSPDHVKRMCRDGKVKAIHIGNTWVLDSTQPNPKKSKEELKMNKNELIKQVNEITNGERFTTPEQLENLQEVPYLYVDNAGLSGTGKGTLYVLYIMDEEGNPTEEIGEIVVVYPTIYPESME